MHTHCKASHTHALTDAASTSIHRNENKPPPFVVHAHAAMPLGPGARLGAPEVEPGIFISVHVKSVCWRRALVCCSCESAGSLLLLLLLLLLMMVVMVVADALLCSIKPLKSRAYTARALVCIDTRAMRCTASKCDRSSTDMTMKS